MIWEQVVTAIPDAVVVDADNVCEYVHAGTSKAAFGPEDFPSIVPPFPLMWIETGAPSRCVTEKQTFKWKRDLHGAQWGMLFWTNDLNAENEDEREATLDAVLEWHKGFSIGKPLVIERGNVRWIIRGICFVKFGGDTAPTGPLCELWMLIDRSGSIMADAEDGSPAMWMAAPGITDPDHEFIPFLQGMQQAWMTPLFLAISLMNCQNVVRIENYPKRHDVREAKRKGRPAPTKFYTLQIEPMRKVLATEGRSGEVGLVKAMHICRGHFATYTDQKPLFGKYAGRFWIPAHVRGSAESGNVVKDYRVKAPREAA